MKKMLEFGAVTCRRAKRITPLSLIVANLLECRSAAQANPYLAKPAEPTVKVRNGTCDVTSGFVHFYAALDSRLFDKCGINAEHVVRGGAVALSALAADEINFLYCNADASIARIATEVGGKLIASPLVGLPYVVPARKDIKRPADLRGKSPGVTRPGDFTYKLAKEFLKKFNLSEKERTLGIVSTRCRMTVNGFSHAGGVWEAT